MGASRSRRVASSVARQQLEAWLHSPRGRRLIELERVQLESALRDVFGRHLLQLGSWGWGPELVSSSQTLHCSVLGTVAELGAGAVTDPEQLPVLSKSVDAVVLPHTLEFVDSPHKVLREVDRVLTDRGRLLVLGFNPWGSWALRGRLGFRHRQFPASARYYSAGRVEDWMELLGFEIVDLRRYSVGMPWLAQQTGRGRWQLSDVLSPFAEAYLLVARKRVLPMTLLGRPQRAQVRNLIGAALPSSASTSASCLSADSETQAKE